MLENPIFWLKKLTLSGMSKENQDNWYSAIQITKNQTVYGKKLKLVQYLKKIVKNSHLIDIPCYFDQNTLDEIESERLHGHAIFLCRYAYGHFTQQCGENHFLSEICKISPGKIQVYFMLMGNFRRH